MRHAWLPLVLIAGAASAVPSGHKWFFPACAPSCPSAMTCVSNRCVPKVSFAASVDNTGGVLISGGVTMATFLARAPEDFRAWTSARVTTCSTSYDVAMGPNFSSPAGISAMASGDGRNSVIWLTGTSWRYSTATLALTTTNFYTPSNEIFDADMELNNNVAWDTTGTVSTSYDLESVLTHEAGHFLGLDHTPAVFEAVMYPLVQPGVIKRNLAAADLNDVCTVYPASPGALGSACTSSTTCNAPLVCEGPVGATSLSCVQDCASAGATCPSGMTCRASTSGFACLPTVGVPDQCKFCSSGQGCSSGICLLSLADFTTFCSLTCTDSSQCGPGYTCNTSSAGSYCLPTATCSNQCTSAADCSVDYTCVGGACLPGGATGNRCEITGYCQSCNTCVNTGGSVAFCQPCCGAASAGGTQCTSCSTTTCGASQACTGLVSGDSACLAQTGPGLCQTCDANHACSAGFSCVAGRCHAACNPQTPGTCAACIPINGGGGACACADEQATVGQPCGNVSGAIAGCVQGLACVGAPQAVCRALCNVSQPSSCPVGEACQLTGGVAVCLPGAAGNACTPCTNAGTCNTGLSCVLGRCYAGCNVNVAGTCSGCVQTNVSGVGICGCSDQLSNVNGPCGTSPTVKVCPSGSQCLNGSCREQCDPQNPANCVGGTSCLPLGAVNYCQDQPVATGGGAGGGGSSTGGGGSRGGGAGGGGGDGTGGGSVNSAGCGCSTIDSGWLFGLLGVFALGARRRSPASR